jgi:hypothetical protein
LKFYIALLDVDGPVWRMKYLKRKSMPMVDI